MSFDQSVSNTTSPNVASKILPVQTEAAGSSSDVVSSGADNPGMEDISSAEVITPNVEEESEFTSVTTAETAEIFRPRTPVEGSKFPATTPSRSIAATPINNEAQQDSPTLVNFNQQLEKSEKSNAKAEKYYRILYLSAFAIFGTTLRVYFARFFGADCEFPLVDDFLTPLSRQICITAAGWSVQLRNAIFTDLPSNIIGCFVMGVLSSINPDTPPNFPCLRKENQPNKRFHQALTVGLCGCLTTFAAWNGQMVRMLNGADTDLSTSIGSVVLGYALGLLASVGSFVVGGKTFLFLYQCRNETPSITQTKTDSSFDIEESCFDNNANNSPSVEDNATFEPQRVQRKRSGVRAVCNWYTVPLLLVTVLFIAFLVADLALGMTFYRSMWITCVLSPSGAFLRWKLSNYNKNVSIRPFSLLDWFPWGTFAANLAASMLFVLLFAIQIRFLQGYEDQYPWTIAIFNGIRTGFAGSLSTVSTFAKEIVHLFILYPKQAKPVYYSLATILISMTLSMCIYSPIVGSG